MRTQARAKELKAKAKRAEEASKADKVEGTPWDDIVKNIEEKFWETVGGKDAEGHE